MSVPSHRTVHPAVHPLITGRWSPRSFDGSAMPQEDLEAICTAAGLAPSASNIQPWTFIYAHNGDENWDRLMGLLVEFNQGWAKDASVLIFAISDTVSRKEGYDPRPSHSHSFDTGAAWAMLALQAQHMGYHTHGMTGVDFDRAAKELGVPDDHRVEAAIAIGKIAPAERLPDGLREAEMISGRKPVSEIMKAGRF
ncbi:MAG: nitroreductase family protein [Sphingomonadaceae bacterium]|nr:nitroreductase family protein [Sphingomonadaceae bacterium]